MEIKSYLLIFLFCNLCFLIKGSKDSKGCSLSNLFSIEPSADIYRDKQFKKIKGNKYWIVSKTESSVQKVLGVYFDNGSNEYYFNLATFDQTDISQVWNLKL